MRLQTVFSRRCLRWGQLLLGLVMGAGLWAVGALDLAVAQGGVARPVVDTTLGKVIGVLRHGVHEYRGIPFAEPLRTQDRWTRARPVQPWSSPLDAERFGAACPQTARFDLTEQSLVEDCLTLNVSVPRDLAPGERLPVMVYLPGGGFVGGSSNLYRLDKLAREGRIIVVSINYRVGALGFMAHPALAGDPSNGNLGLEDQRLALRWVQQHISAFQGDPARVTIAGESAGAASVCLHLLGGESSRGLFHQAIAASYGCLYPWQPLASALRYDSTIQHALFKPTWQLMAERTGCFEPARPGSAEELACLRGKPLTELLAAQEKVAAEQPVFPFSPKIDGGPGSPVSLKAFSRGEVAAHLHRVPFLLGGTEDELRLYVAYDVLGGLLPDPARVTAAQMTSSYLQIYYGLDPQRPPGSPRAWTQAELQTLIDEYFPAGVATASQLGSMFSDYTPVAGLNNCAVSQAGRVLSQLGSVVWRWQFADPDAPVLGVGIAPGKDPRMELGAVHSSELNSLFPNLSNTAAINAPDLPAKSQRLADQLVQVWAQFVRTGSPVTADTPGWRPIGSDGLDQVMRFRPDRIETFDARSRHRCAFWERLSPALLIPD